MPPTAKTTTPDQDSEDHDDDEQLDEGEPLVASPPGRFFDHFYFHNHSLQGIKGPPIWSNVPLRFFATPGVRHTRCKSEHTGTRRGYP